MLIYEWILQAAPCCGCSCFSSMADPRAIEHIGLMWVAKHVDSVKKGKIGYYFKNPLHLFGIEQIRTLRSNVYRGICGRHERHHMAHQCEKCGKDWFWKQNLQPLHQKRASVSFTYDQASNWHRNAFTRRPSGWLSLSYTSLFCIFIF